MVELSQKVFGAVISQSSTRLGPAWADGQTAFKCMNASCPRVWMAAGAGLDGPEPVSVQLSGQPGRVLMNGSQQPRSNITLLLWLRLSAACISGWATADYIHSILFKTWFLIRSRGSWFFSNHELFFLILGPFLIWLKMTRRQRGGLLMVILTIPGVSCGCLRGMKENCWDSAVGSPLWLRLCCCCCPDTGSLARWRPDSKSPCRGWSPWAGGSTGGRAGAARVAPSSPSVATCKHNRVSIFSFT